MPAHPLPRRLAALAAIAGLALAVALALPWPAAAQPVLQTPSRPAAVPASWNLLAHAWAALTSLWGEAGLIIDPNGVGAAPPAPPPPAAGLGIDPDGLCAATPGTTAQSDAGCVIDPNGLCAAASGTTGHLDAGCGIDPDGAH